MKKTYWWRWGIVGISIFGVLVSYLFGHKIGLDLPYQRTFFCENFPCIETAFSSIGKPLFLYALFLFVTSIALFFVYDRVFLAWLKFAIIWSVTAGILVSLAPVSQGGWLGFGPEKWSVTMIMGWGLFIISIVFLVWKSSSQKR
jgi:hypothetical protein